MNISSIDSNWLMQKLRLSPEEAVITSVSSIAAGQGMIGSIYCIATTGSSYIIKLSPGLDSMWYGYLKKMQPFRREAEAYRFLAPYQSELAGAVPRCLWSEYASDGKGVIVLENLLEQNAVMQPMNAPVSMDYYRSVLRSVAKVHALHAATRNTVSKHACPHKWMFSGNSRSLADILKAGLSQTIDIVKQHRSNPAAGQVWCQIADLDIGLALRQTHLRGKLVSLCHGDLWMNNVMFIKEPNTIRTCIIDWQFASWGNPLVDVSFFLLSSLDAQSRLKLTENIVAFYYSELMRYTRARLDYSLEDCREDYKRAYSYGAIMSLASLEAFIAASPPEQAADWTEKALHLAEEFLACNSLHISDKQPSFK